MDTLACGIETPPADRAAPGPLAASMDRLVTQAEGFGECLQRRLIAQSPELPALFRQATATHGLQVLQSMQALDAARQQPDRLRELCAELMDRYRAHALCEAHFDALGAALLGCLRELLAETFDEATEEAWASLYGEIAETMIALGLSERG